MPEIKTYEPGTFCWVELATTNGKGAKKFYTQFFGWDYFDAPAGPDMVYTMFKRREQDVAALYQMGKEEEGTSPHWRSYVSVNDADHVTSKAKALGGKVLAEPFDVFDAGRMAVIQDPTGATFSLWQPKEHIGARLVNEPGTFCWNELATRDTRTATEFYSKLFGWKTRVQQMGLTTYTTFMVGDHPNAGMLQMTKEWGDVPPHWMVYFAVDDCEKSVDKAKNLGAGIMVPPTDIPEVGRFSVLQDPHEAVFSVIRLANPPA